MRLIKDVTREYESFHKSLQYFTKGTETSRDLKLLSFEGSRQNNNLLEKYSFFVQNLSSFHKKVQETQSLLQIHSLFQEFVKRIVNAKEVEIFLFGESDRSLIPVNKNASVIHISTVNKALKDGILEWVFETKKATIIPDLSSYTNNGSRINQLIFPIYDSKSNYGLVSIITSINKIPEDSLENNAIQTLLGIVVPMIVSLRQKLSINKLYQELQVYQSKIQNDVDVYAIGELTEGIIEHIGEPLQVIISLIDMLETETPQIDVEVTQKIKEQVKKVCELTGRLSKFAGLNKPVAQKSQPCNINKMIKEFRNIISSSLKNLGLECELDLEENIPPVLSDPNDIKQILTSIFTLLKSASKKGGAFIVQTKYLKERVVVSVFTTEQIEGVSKNNLNKSNVTLNLVHELMKKNEGRAEFNSLPLKGTIIHLVFPLIRKLAL